MVVSGSAPPASLPTTTHGRASIAATLGSDMPNVTLPRMFFSPMVSAMMASTQSIFRLAAISFRRLPSYCFHSGRLNPAIWYASGELAWQYVSAPGDTSVISLRMRACNDASCSRSSSLPSAATQPGMQAERLLPEAGYGYIVAFTSWPAARAESSLAMAGVARGQLRWPLALKW